MRLFLPALVLLIVISTLVQAQAITTDPLAQNAYCAGDVITVDYTLTGAVNPGNAFILQLSNRAGRFDSGFQNVGSVVSGQSGSINFEVPSVLPGSSSYRFRVISSNPRVNGSDNGSDIAIDRAPNANVAYDDAIFNVGAGKPHAFVGEPIQFKANGKVWWNFGIGVGAVPEQTSAINPVVSYATPGIKNIRLLSYSPNARCEDASDLTLTVLPLNPVLPADVHIVQGEEVFDINNPAPQYIWVCPGGICRIEHGGKNEMIFVEGGGSLESRSALGSLIYVKEAGSVSTLHHFNGRLVYEEGAGYVSLPWSVKKVDDMVFDYTDVPPNGCPSLAPYTVQIKPDVRGIHIAEDDNNSAAEYWIHENGVLTSRGNGNVYYIESGGELRVQGADSKIYVKEGGMVNVEQGSGHRIFYESEGSIVNAGDGAILLPSSGITFISQVSSVERETGSAIEQGRLSMSPNPSTGTVELRVDEVGGRVERVEVYDMRGRKAYEVDVRDERVEISLDGYPAGVYHVRAITSEGVVTGRLVIQ